MLRPVTVLRAFYGALSAAGPLHSDAACYRNSKVGAILGCIPKTLKYKYKNMFILKESVTKNRNKRNIVVVSTIFRINGADFETAKDNPPDVS